MHGYGAVHALNLVRLSSAGVLSFVAAADPDPRPAKEDRFEPSTRIYTDLGDLLAVHDVDVAIVSSPIHTHVPLAEAALRSGADVLLEKPPAPSFAGFEDLSPGRGGDRTQLPGRVPDARVEALEVLRAAIASGELGEVGGSAAAAPGSGGVGTGNARAVGRPALARRLRRHGRRDHEPVRARA